MDGIEKVAYALLGFVSLLYLAVIVAGLIAALPWGVVAALRSLVSGEIIEYTKPLAEAREQSLDRMVAEAKKLADGIVAVRFVTAPTMQDAAEMLAYGTAVKLDKSQP